MYIDNSPADYADGGMAVFSLGMFILCVVLPALLLLIGFGPQVMFSVSKPAGEGCVKSLLLLGFVCIIIAVAFLCAAGSFITGGSTISVR